MAKAVSFFSANSFTWRGVMICSARCLSSSGRIGCMASGRSSPLTRMVGGRPTLSSKSEPCRCTIWEMACLKLKGGIAPSEESGSDIRIHPEEDLAELDRLRVFDADFPHHAPELGLDLVHDLHRLNDADGLTRADSRA